MVGLVLVSHSRELADALARFAEQASAARIRVAVAAGVGSAGAELGTDAPAIAEAVRSVSGPDGVLVLMDLGSAVLAAETALELLPEEVRSGVRLCPAPLVEGAIAAAVQIALGNGLEEVFREATGALAPKAGHLGSPAAVPQRAASEAAFTPAEAYREISATVLNAHGLHLRPAARLVRTAARFRAEVRVGKLGSDKPPVSAASLNDIATLGLAQGERVVFQARGIEAREALEALRRLAEEGFGEPPGPSTEAEPRPQAPPLETPGEGLGLLQGVPVSEGFAVAPVLVLTRVPLAPMDRPSFPPEQELAALQEALDRERAVLAQEHLDVAARLGQEKGALFDAFRLILEDPAFLDQATEEIFVRRRNAEHALDIGIRGIAGRYRGLADPYARQRAADVLGLGQRVLQRLQGYREQAVPTGSAGPVLLAVDELSPPDAVRLDARAILGVLTVRGGPTSHSAVLVRSLGIPCVSGLPDALLRLPAGTLAALDGATGRVWVEPDPAIVARVEAGRAEWLRRQTAAAGLRREPAASRDGRRFDVEANIAGVTDARQAVAQGAEGVGVLRTEFLFLDRTRPPSEGEQLEALLLITSCLQERPLTVRTLDIGGDKTVPYLAMPVEANPYLGIRGVRLCLRRVELFQTQLRAVLRSAERHDVRVLFPMITTLEELDGALAQLALARAGLAREGVPHRWPLPVGVMVETPSAALLIEAILERADFVSVGTNDLTQYTLAAERGSPALAGYEDALHPAVLALIRQVAEAAARCGRTAAVCGEIAADPVAIPVLAGLGVRAFSLNPHGIPRVKETLRRLDTQAAARWAAELFGCRTAAEVRRRAADYYNALPGGDA